MSVPTKEVDPVRKEKNFPFPEIIDSLNTVNVSEPEDGMPPYLQLMEGKLRVPLGSTPKDYIIRSHELAHMKWSPVHRGALDGVNERYWQVTEDIRINGMMRDLCGIEVGPAMDVDEIKKLSAAVFKGGHPASQLFFLSLIKDHVNDQYERLKKHAAEGVVDGVEYVHEIIFGQFRTTAPSYRNAIDAAKWLEVNFPIEEEDIDHIMEALQPFEKNPDPPFQILTPPLRNRSLAVRQASFKRRIPAEKGSVMFAPHRWCIDRHVFDRRKKMTRGSVLMDVSGSMALSQNDIMNMVAANPYGTFAIHSTTDNCSRVDLQILAKNGRYVDKRDLIEMDSENGGDIHAVRWLAKQKKPRFWITDFQVGDVHLCEQAVKRAEIKWVHDIPEMLKILRGMA